MSSQRREEKRAFPLKNRSWVRAVFLYDAWKGMALYDAIAAAPFDECVEDFGGVPFLVLEMGCDNKQRLLRLGDHHNVRGCVGICDDEMDEEKTTPSFSAPCHPPFSSPANVTFYTTESSSSWNTPELLLGTFDVIAFFDAFPHVLCRYHFFRGPRGTAKEEKTQGVLFLDGLEAWAAHSIQLCSPLGGTLILTYPDADMVRAVHKNAIVVPESFTTSDKSLQEGEKEEEENASHFSIPPHMQWWRPPAHMSKCVVRGEMIQEALSMACKNGFRKPPRVLYRMTLWELLSRRGHLTKEEKESPIIRFFLSGHCVHVVALSPVDVACGDKQRCLK